jgi:hypothetical protein
MSAVEASPDNELAAHRSVPRELIVLGLLVVLADATVYRGHGYAGLAALAVGTPILLWLGVGRRRVTGSLILLATMLTGLAARLAWYGSPLAVACGIVLILVAATVIGGATARPLAVFLTACQIMPAGAYALVCYWRALPRWRPIRLLWSLSILLPLIAVLAFGSLFVLANPDVRQLVAQYFEQLFERLGDWLSGIALEPLRWFFWLVAAWLFAGLLRPLIVLPKSEPVTDEPPSKPAPAPLFAACRNTLAAVVLLFAGYLVFEFSTLWFREFPDGFYYAGYAHEGAAWLTVALGLATLVLSIIFRGRVLLDPRLKALRRWAWAWSALNLLLAAAVYNRMFIYIDFNGMTYMRIVGLFGITSVVAGFVLVMVKIATNRDFGWLVRRQIAALAVTIFLFVLTPVDAVAVAWNVRSILSGDERAVMQIGVQPLNTEGILALPPLLACETPEVHAGVRALLARRHGEIAGRQLRRQTLGWTSWQFAEQRALKRLEQLRDEWEPFADEQLQAKTLSDFYDYAYQWY